MEHVHTWRCPDLSLAQTLECGQCFRYRKEAEDSYTVIAAERVIRLRQEGDSILFYDTAEVAFWKAYFDGDRDYGALKKRLCKDDAIMGEAIAFAPGIRILRQEFFETLLSFMISQNNHIPRIKGLIEKLATTYGKALPGGLYAFPTAEELAHVTEADLRALGCGFRARYLVDAVDKVLAGRFDLAEMEKLPTAELRSRLMEICGVGQKVADCILLFALGRGEVFPADVWIRRVFCMAYEKGAELSPKALQEKAAARFGADAGFAQQYLFHYGRMKKIGKTNYQKSSPK